MTGDGSSPRRLRVDARRNRERLLAAATDVLVEQGVDAPLDEIARRAGVGIATLYRRFADREALLRVVALDVLERVAAEARAALAEEPDPFSALARYLHRSLDVRVAAVMPVLDGRLDLDKDTEVRAARDALTPLFSAIVTGAHDSGQLRPDIGMGDIGIMVIRLARPLRGTFDREFDEATAHRQLDIMLDGMRAPSPASGRRMTIEDVRRRRAAGTVRPPASD